MTGCDWIRDFQGSITVCDLHGIILEMNEKAAVAYQEYGGKELVGKNLLDCHPEPARDRVKQLLDSGESNVYTIEKNGIRKLVYQVPWYRSSQRCGMVELVLEIPIDMPHFVR